MIACTNCRQDIEREDQFCPFCGAPQRATATPVVVATAPSSSSGARRITSTSTPRTGQGAATPSNGGTLGTRLLQRVRNASGDRFDVIRLLGHGGMAAVYLAHDLKLDRQVALKVMSPALESSTAMTQKFLDEARRTARLSHPNIVVVHDVVELDDLVFIVMNLVNGATLEQAVPWLPTIGAADARKLNIQVVQTVLRNVAAGLEYAHEMGIIHRDVKPSNVMLTLKGDIVVSDFGVAKVVSGAPQEKSSLLMGTPTYMSPEQCRGVAVSGASDQYSLGVMAYELLTGTPPFVGERLQVQNAHVDRDPVPLRKLRPDVPGDLARAVTKMLAKHPRDRYDSMADVMDAVSSGLDANDQQPRRLLSVAANQARAALGDLGMKSQGGESPVTPLAKAEPGSVRVLAPEVLEFGQTFKVTAEVFGAEGEPMTSGGVLFSSDEPTVVRVEAWTGTAIAIGAGTATVTAGVGAARGSASVTVLPAPAQAAPRLPAMNRTWIYAAGGVAVAAIAVVLGMGALRGKPPVVDGVYSPSAIAAVRGQSMEFRGPLRRADLSALAGANAQAIDGQLLMRGSSASVPVQDVQLKPDDGFAVRATLARDADAATTIGGIHLYGRDSTSFLIEWSLGEQPTYSVQSIGADGVARMLVPATPINGSAGDTLGVEVLVVNDELRLYADGRLLDAPKQLSARLSGLCGLFARPGYSQRFSNIVGVSLRQP